MGGCNKRADITWRKSSYSQVGDCVEMALVSDGVLVRDSKNRDGSTLYIDTTEWCAVLSMVKYESNR
jgi:hypothetical protein